MISINGKVDVWECIFRECKALCCIPPLITIGDAKRISKSMGLKPAEFLDAINSGDKGLFRVRSKGEKCMFLKEDYICKLHKKNFAEQNFCARKIPTGFLGPISQSEIRAQSALKADSGEKNSKPIFCQMFPFRFDGITYTDEIILKIRLAEKCPGLGRGDGVGEEFRLKIEELGSKFIREIEEYIKSEVEGKKFEEIFDAWG